MLMHGWPPVLSRAVWTLAIAIAVVANVSAVLGLIDPFAALMASFPLILLAFRAIDSAGNAPPSGVDGAHQPVMLDAQPGGDQPPGPSLPA